MTKRIGETIHALRKERGWSTTALGRRAGIPASEVSRLERNPGAGPSWRTLQGLAKAFAISVSDLTADVPRLPDEDPIVAQQVEGLVRAVHDGQMDAEMAIKILRNQGFLERRPVRVHEEREATLD